MPFSFTLETHNVTFPGQIAVRVLDKNGAAIPSSAFTAAKFHSSQPDQWTGTMTVMQEGELQLDVQVTGKPAKNTPISLTVGPGPSLTALKGSRKATVHETATLTLDHANLSLSDLVVTAKHSNGKDVGVKLNEGKDGKWDASFSTTEAGTVTVFATILDMPAPGFPIEFVIAEERVAKMTKLDTGKGTTFVGQPVSLTIDTKNVKANELEPTVKDAQGKTVPCKLTAAGNQVFLEFTPATQGDHSVGVNLVGKPIDGAPQTIHVEPRPVARVEKIEKLPYAGQTGKVAIKTVNVKAADLEVTVEDPAGKTTVAALKDVADGKIDFDFSPAVHGEYTIAVAAKGIATIEGSPVSVTVQQKPVARLEKIEDLPYAGETGKVAIKCVNMKAADLEVTVADPAGKKTKADLKDAGTGKVEFEFAPATVGKYSVEVVAKKADATVEGSPLAVNIEAKPSAHLKKPSATALRNKPYKMGVETTNVKSADLAVTITAPSGKKVNTTLSDPAAGKVDIDFTPTEKGKHKIEASLKGQNVNGFPYTLDVEAPSAKLQKLEDPARAGEDVVLNITINYAKASDLVVKVLDPKGQPLSLAPEVIDLADGTVELAFCPAVPGDHAVEVQLDGSVIDGAPVVIKVGALPRYPPYDFPMPGHGSFGLKQSEPAAIRTLTSPRLPGSPRGPASPRGPRSDAPNMSELKAAAMTFKVPQTKAQKDAEKKDTEAKKEEPKKDEAKKDEAKKEEPKKDAKKDSEHKHGDKDHKHGEHKHGEHKHGEHKREKKDDKKK